MEIVMLGLAGLALVVAAYALKKVSDIPSPVRHSDPVPVDAYTKNEVDMLLKGLQDAHEHLMNRVYQLQGKVQELLSGNK